MPLPQLPPEVWSNILGQILHNVRGDGTVMRAKTVRAGRTRWPNKHASDFESDGDSDVKLSAFLDLRRVNCESVKCQYAVLY